MTASEPHADDALTVPPSNIDHFRRIPKREITALLPSKEDALAGWRDLMLSHMDVTRPRILEGAEGARIFDEHGAYHGLKARLQRLWQTLGNLENDLAVYGEGLRDGKALLSVGCPPSVVLEAARVLQTHGGHAMLYFGRYSAERLSGPYLLSE
jgi:hypothetical protein